MANLLALATLDISFLLRPLPSAGITRPHRYYGPLRHLSRPGLSLAGLRLEPLLHRVRLPVLRPNSLSTHALANTPAESPI